MSGEVQVLVFAVVQAATGPGWWAWRRMWRARRWGGSAAGSLPEEIIHASERTDPGYNV